MVYWLSLVWATFVMEGRVIGVEAQGAASGDGGGGRTGRGWGGRLPVPARQSHAGTCAHRLRAAPPTLTPRRPRPCTHSLDIPKRINNHDFSSTHHREPSGITTKIFRSRFNWGFIAYGSIVQSFRYCLHHQYNISAGNVVLITARIMRVNMNDCHPKMYERRGRIKIRCI